MASVVKIPREEIVQMFRELGKLKASSWSDDQLEEELLKLPDHVQSDDFDEHAIEWTREGRETFYSVMETLQDEGVVSFRDGDEVSPKEAPKKSPKEVSGDEEFDLEETAEGVDREEDEGDVQKAIKKRGRGRPPKDRTVPEVPVAPHNGFTFTEVSAKLLNPTKELAARFKDMATFPRDREFSDRRAEKILQALRNNEFRGSEWVSCHVADNNQTYRLNGKHTSAMVHKFLEEGGKVDRKVLVREYEVPSLRDAAGVFSTMDTKDASRTKADVLKGFASTVKETEALSSRLVNLVTAGVSYGLYEKKYKKVSTTDQAGVLLANKRFAKFVGSVLNDDSLERADPPKTVRDVRHMMRMSVIAAMFKTWRMDPEDASDFWLAVRDDSNDEKKSPRRVIYKFLTESKVGRGARKVSEVEVFVKCLQAWNAYRNGDREVTLRWSENTPTPEVK